MSGRVRLNRFGRSYDSFISEASNEEIVSISKELTEELSSQVRLVNASGLALLAISLVTMILSVMVISNSSTTLPGNAKSIVFLLRILSVALTCASAAMAATAISKSMNASSISTIYWRNIRETADDEKVYEQMNSVRTLNFIVGTSKNNVKSSVTFLMVGGVLLGIAFLYELLVLGGYM